MISPHFLENYFAEVKIKNDHMIDKMEDRVKHAFNKYDDVLIMWLKNVNDGHVILGLFFERWLMENNKSSIHQKPKTTIRVKWDKLDTDKYRDNTRFKMTENNKLLMGGNTEKSVKVFTNILNESIAELIPARKIRKNKPKLSLKFGMEKLKEH